MSTDGKPRLIFDLDETIVHTVLRQDLCAEAIQKLMDADEITADTDGDSLVYTNDRRPHMPTLEPSGPDFITNGDDGDDDDDDFDDGSGKPKIYLPSRPAKTNITNFPVAKTGGYDSECLVDRRTGRAKFASEDSIVTDYAVAYIRPGILEVLHRLAEKFTLCLCTFGMLKYVTDVLRAIDRDGALFGDRVLVRANFLGNVKCVPREWGDLGDVVVVDDRVDVWETGTTVIRVDSFALSSVPARGSKERADMERYACELALNLENCAASYRGAQEFRKRRRVDQQQQQQQNVQSDAAAWQREHSVGLAEHIAMFWPIMSRIKISVSGSSNNYNIPLSPPLKKEVDMADYLIAKLPSPPPPQQLSVDSPFVLEFPDLTDDEDDGKNNKEKEISEDPEKSAGGNGDEDEMITVMLDCDRAAEVETEMTTCLGEHGSFLGSSIDHRDCGTLVCAEASS